MLAKQLQAELQLATATGWTNVIDAGNVLIGTPPGGADNSRGQAQVPAWTRDWRACGPLIGALDLSIDCAADDTGFVVINIGSGLDDYVQVSVADWPGKDEALRYALTIGAHAKLVAVQPSLQRKKEVTA